MQNRRVIIYGAMAPLLYQKVENQALKNLNPRFNKHDLKNLVRSNVKETLNALLDKEANELVNAQKYERSADRQGYRSGHYKRNF